MASHRWAFSGPFIPSRVFAPFVHGLRPSHAQVCQPRAQAVGLAAAADRKADAKPKRMPAIIRPMVPSAELLQFVEDKAQPRSTMLKLLSSYVKKHNLQDPNDMRMVLCDAKLKKLFGVEKCTILEMSKYITPHLKKPELMGGRYVEEANRVEEEYLKKKEIEEADRIASGLPTKKKKRTRKVSAEAAKDRKEGRKLFKPVILSPELAAICRKEEMPRQEIVKAVWEYIRLNNLQGKPGQPIKCDFLLRKVYDADEIDVRSIMKGIAKHVTNKAPKTNVGTTS